MLYSTSSNVYKCISAQFQACSRHARIYTHSYAITRTHAIMVNKWEKIHSVLPVMLSSHRFEALERECAGLAVLPLRVFTWMLLFLCHYSAHLLYTVSNSPDGFWQLESLQLGPLDCRLYVQANRNLTDEQPCRLCDSQWIQQSKVQKLQDEYVNQIMNK